MTRKLSRREALVSFGAAASAGLVSPAWAQLVPPDAGSRLPEAPRDNSFDILHGVRVEDPFRPLEDGSRSDVQAWIAAEDRRARTFLEANPVHARAAAFLQAVGRYPRMSGFRRLGRRFVSGAFDGVQEQSWLHIRDNLGDPGRPLIDPNATSSDGRVGLAGYYSDRLANKIAYLTTENGGDAQVLRIRDLRTGLDLLDRLEGCRWTSVVWMPDGNAFYYTRPPLPSEPEAWNRTSHRIFYHQLGYPQAADRMVWHLPRLANVFMSLGRSYSTNQLFATARVGTNRQLGYWAGPLGDAMLLTMLVPMGLCSFQPIRNVGSAHYAVTDLDAPRGRIVRVQVHDPRPENWQTIIPEGEGVIDGATLVSNRLLVRRFRDLGHKLGIYDLDGQHRVDVAMDGGPMRIHFLAGEREDSELHLDVDDRRRPARMERLNVMTGRVETVRPSKAPHSLADMELRHVHAKSKDGTEVPVTLMHRADIAADGSNRTLLTGYGSYGISQWPGYSSFVAAWLRLGGVYAVASIRGGGELGRNWHHDGRLAKKQNAIDDFAAAAEWLIGNRIAKPERLGIYGASSGGRLVLTAMVQRPELFGAVVAGVPLVDMLRFARFTFGSAWKAEYGDIDKAEDFKWLMAHSPLHNVKAGAAYPPLLILTADNDERVVPAHAYKMAATLRATAPSSEVYVRTRQGAGHGSGNAYSKAIAYQADIIGFLCSKLGGPILELPKIAA
ncbi:MAG: prolyl oligopeptidase family serine peptidase [Hyphomicrobiaceae bacterium]